MNRYPIWKYVIIVLSLTIAALYALPNFFGERLAVQISGNRSSVAIDNALLAKAEQILSTHQLLDNSRRTLENNTLKISFSDTDSQLKAKALLQQNLGGNYVVALNLVSNSPNWLQRIGAHPMFLGLDLRGGVHFLLEIDMKAAQNRMFERLAGDLRRELRHAKIRYGSIKRIGQHLEVQFKDAEAIEQARRALKSALPILHLAASTSSDNTLTVNLSPEEMIRVQSDAVRQNIAALHNRVNELGVAEPIIQQQGSNRIIVQLPGVQDTAKAKAIIGRTASLEVRLVEDDASKLEAALNGNVPPGYQLMDEVHDGGNTKILVHKQIELSGEQINDAQASFTEHGQPAVDIRLDSNGATLFRQLTHDNVGRRLAMILVEQGQGQVVTAPVIRSEIGGGRVQISGAMTVSDANDIALLLRAGSLAAPMHFIEERTIGPSLGKDNIDSGFYSTLYGFIAIACFMVIYYRVFGLSASFALFANLLLLVALLSLLQAALTLPGIAAIALTLGMAIDSNVLINERIREELRNGSSPQAAINSGYRHAWRTIFDSNITTLIAGLALLIFASGAIRGFAVVHCLGIMTSMFSAVFISRGVVNLIYGYRRRINKLSV